MSMRREKETQREGRTQFAWKKSNQEQADAKGTYQPTRTKRATVQDDGKDSSKSSAGFFKLFAICLQEKKGRPK